MTTITTHVPALIVEPRGAAWLASLFAAVGSGWRLLRVSRAQRMLESRRVAEAAEVRALALDVSREDPRFAADLRAAADRHERG